MLRLHVSLVRQAIAYSSPVLRGLPQNRLHYMVVPSPRGGLGAPRLSSRRLLRTEAREIPSAVVGVLETGIHFFRLLTQHNQRSILQSPLGRTGSNLHDTIHEKQALLPTWTNWRILTSLVTWMLVKPEICLNIQGLLNIYIR